MGGRRFLRTSAAVCPGSGKGCSLRVPVGEPLFPLPLKALLSLSFQNSPARGVPRPRKWPFARNLASVSCEMAGKNFVQLFRTPHKKIRWEGLAELSRPQTTEGKEAPSFPATRASEMTPLMTDRATFLKESSPVRHASLCRKRPLAFFDTLRLPGFAGQPDFTLFGACHSASGPGRTRRQRPAPRRCRAAPTRKKKK